MKSEMQILRFYVVGQRDKQVRHNCIFCVLKYSGVLDVPIGEDNKFMMRHIEEYTHYVINSARRLLAMKYIYSFLDAVNEH